MSKITLQEKGNAFSRASNFLVVGFSLAVLGLVALLTINGQSDVPAFAQIVTMTLIAVGLVLPAVGLFWLKRIFVKRKTEIGKGFALQGLGLIILLFGMAVAVSLSSLTSFLIAAVLIIVSGALSLFGVFAVYGDYKGVGLKSSTVTYLAAGMVLILSGVALIITSNLLTFFYFLQQSGNTVLTDVGATVSAYGCVTLAFSFSNFRKKTF